MGRINLDNRQIRLFISSTFRDMQDERDYLIKRVFPTLKEKAAKREVSLVMIDLRWGITEQESKNGKVIDICLQEIENSFPFFIGLIGDRYGWCPNMEEIKGLEDRYEWLAQDIASGFSVTEIEMQYGVLRNPNVLNAFFYIKHAHVPPAEHEDSVKLNRLKESVRNNGRYPVKEYTSVEDLGQQIAVDFTETLDRLYPEKALNEHERLRLPHKVFLNKLREFYLPDKNGFALLDTFLLDNSRICCVGGPSGSGKSALVANWIKKYETIDDYMVVYHQVGLGACGTNIDLIIERINRELAASSDSSSKKVIVAIDGLFSILERKDQNAFYNYLIRTKIINKIILIDPFESGKDVDQCDKYYCPTIHRDADYWRLFTREYLKQFRKRLSGQQMESIVSNPLMRNASTLKALLDEIVSYGDFESLSRHIEDLSSASSREEFYQKYLTGLEQEYGSDVVRPILGCLSISRHGLPEESFTRISGTTQLKCSQFYNAIKGFLMASEGGRWVFTGMEDAVRFHYGIINEFNSWGPNAATFRWMVYNACDDEFNRYAFTEKCYQLYMLEEYDRLLSLLPDYASFGLSLNEFVRELLLINHACSSKAAGPDNTEFRFILRVLSAIATIVFTSTEPSFEIDDHSLWELVTSIPFYVNLLNDIENDEMIAAKELRELDKISSIASNYLTKRAEQETDGRKAKRYLTVLTDLAEEMKGTGNNNMAKPAPDNDPQSLLLLGKKYLQGIGLEKDEHKAFRLIKKAAALDNPEAIHLLASLYASGTGCPANVSTAAELYAKAAQAGKPESQHQLAVLYASGKGVEKNLIQALHWNGLAIKTFEKAKGFHNPKTIAYNNDQAWYYYLMGEYEKANVYINNAVGGFIDTTPVRLKAVAFDTQGDILNALGQRDEAIKKYQTSLNLLESIIVNDDERLDDLRLKIQLLSS